MEDRGDEVRAGISQATRPGEAARYQRWIGALTMMLGLVLASPLAAADTLPRAQVASACAPFLMTYFIGEEREDLLHCENGLCIRRDRHPVFGAKGLNSAGKIFIASISTVYPVNRGQAVK